MSLWPPGVVQRLSSQTPPQHVVQQPRAVAVGGSWQHFQQHQQAQLCLLLEQQQSLHYQQLQQDPSWDPLQYVLQQQAPQQQPLPPSIRGRGVAVVAATAASASARQQRHSSSSSSTAAVADASTAGWPAATFDSITDVVDLQHALVQWPQDKQPKLGCITKNKLRKLTAAELRAELCRLQAADSKGLKEDLINAVLACLLHPTNSGPAAAAAAAAAAASGSVELAALTPRGLQLLQHLSPALAAAVQQQGSGLQALASCQVSELRAALQAVWPLMQPVVSSSSSSKQQLMGGSAADLVQTLLLCLATCAGMDEQLVAVAGAAAAGAAAAGAAGPPPETRTVDRPKAAPAAPAAVAPPPAAAAAAAPAAAAATDPADIRRQFQEALQQMAEQVSTQPPQQQQQNAAVRTAQSSSSSSSRGKPQEAPTASLDNPPAAEAAPVRQQKQQQEVQQKAEKQQQQQVPEVPPGYTQPHGPLVVPGTMPPYDPAEAAAVAAAVGVSLEDLPPLAQQARGHVMDVDWMAGFTDQERDLVLKANRSGLTLTLVGGAVEGGLAGDSSSRCVALMRERDSWLFDVGEDTQRLLMWQEHLRPSKLHRVVISRQSPDALLGLPGVLCVIGSSREKGHEKADIPVHVFGPEGTCEFLNTMYDCGNTFLEMPVVVHEFVHHAVSPEQTAPQMFNTRSKLWRVLVPPDQLNPDGFVDARLDNFSPLEGRGRTKSGSRSSGGVLAKNPRAGYRPLRTPPPGDPTLTGLPRSGMTWTLQADEAAMLTAVAVEAPDLAWAMVWQEADKQGNLSVPRCQALGVSNGELYGVLKTGTAVPNDDGILIPAPMVCTQDKPGRKVVLLPACDSAAAVGPHAADADVMIADAAAAQDAAPAGAPLGTGLGVCAREWGVRALLATAMPQDEAVRRARNLENNWFNPAWRNKRLGAASLYTGGSSSSGSSSDDELSTPSLGQQQQQLQGEASAGGDSGPGQQQEEQEQLLKPWLAALEAAQAQDPALGSFLQAVAQQYDQGLLLPGRDGLSLIVEDNSGTALPPPLDMKAKEAEARAVSLLMCIDALEPGNKQQKQQSRPQEQRQWQQGGGRGSSKGRGGGGGGGGQQQQWRQQRPAGQFQQQQQQQQRGGGGGRGQQQWQQQWQQQQQQQQQRGERSVAR